MTTARAAVDAFLAGFHALRPVHATFIGEAGHDHRLPDWSTEGVAHEAEVLRDLAARLAPWSTLPDAPTWDALDAALACACVEVQRAELAGRHFQRGNPSLAIGEATFALIGLMVRGEGPVAARAEALHARLREVPRFLGSALDVVAEAPVPPTWRAKALRECDGARALLAGGLDTWRREEAIPDDLGRALRVAGDGALAAVEAFAARLGALPGDEAPARACGPDMLALLVRRGHWVERPLDDLLGEVRDAFAQARDALDGLARAAHPDGLPGVLEALAAAHPTPAGYLDAFGRTWEASRMVAEAHDLVTWPDAPIRYVPIPPATCEAAPFLYYLFYRSPAPLAWPAVHDYVVSPIDGLSGDALARHLRAWNDSVIKLNHVVHHGGLGHHVQNHHAAHGRSRIGRIAAVDCASRIAMFLGGSMAEGWACYATDLMEECGFLTPLERVAEQQSRVRMLARALVDLEFHAGARTFEGAVRLYADAVGMPEGAAHAEAVKNSMFPGTALMYWLGTSQLHALRAAERRRLGGAFSQRAFHDRVLSFGSVPVAVAARLVPLPPC